MQGIYNWLLDFCFYGFLDSIIIYMFIVKLFLNKNSNISSTVKHCLIISFGMSLITSLVPIFGLSQILMGIYIGIIINKINKVSLFKSILYSLISVLLFYFFEITIHNILLYLFNFNGLVLNLNNIYRLLIFMFCKFIEIIIIWWCYKMKLVWGGTIRR